MFLGAQKATLEKRLNMASQAYLAASEYSTNERQPLLSRASTFSPEKFERLFQLSELPSATTIEALVNQGMTHSELKPDQQEAFKSYLYGVLNQTYTENAKEFHEQPRAFTHLVEFVANDPTVMKNLAHSYEREAPISQRSIHEAFTSHVKPLLDELTSTVDNTVTEQKKALAEVFNTSRPFSSAHCKGTARPQPKHAPLGPESYDL